MHDGEKAENKVKGKKNITIAIFKHENTLD